MPLQFLVWLLATLAQAASLALSMHITMQFTDLEADSTNPHDAASSVNAVVLWEYGLQAGLAAWLLANGKWISFIVPGALTAWHWRHRRHFVDVTEIYRQVKPRRRQAVTKLVINIFLFALVMYNLVYVVLHSLLTPAGKAAARDMFMEAAATIQ